MAFETIKQIVTLNIQKLIDGLASAGYKDEPDNLPFVTFAPENLEQLLKLLKSFDENQLEQTWKTLVQALASDRALTATRNIFTGSHSPAKASMIDSTQLSENDSTLTVIEKGYSFDYKSEGGRRGADRDQACLEATHSFKHAYHRDADKFSNAKIDALIDARASLQMAVVSLKELKQSEQLVNITGELYEVQQIKLNGFAHHIFKGLTGYLSALQALESLQKLEKTIADYKPADEQTTIQEAAQRKTQNILAETLSEVITMGLIAFDDHHAYDHFDPEHLRSKDENSPVFSKIEKFSKRLFANQQQLFGLEQTTLSFLPLRQNSAEKKAEVYPYLAAHPEIGGAKFIELLNERKAILAEYCQFLRSKEVTESKFNNSVSKVYVSPFDKKNISNLQRFEAELKMVTQLIPEVVNHYPSDIIIAGQMAILEEQFKALTKAADIDLASLLADAAEYEKQLMERNQEVKTLSGVKETADLYDKVIELRNQINNRTKKILSSLNAVQHTIASIDEHRRAANYQAFAPMLELYKKHLAQLQAKQSAPEWSNSEKVINTVIDIDRHKEAIAELEADALDLRNAEEFIAKATEPDMQKKIADIKALTSQLINPAIRHYFYVNPRLLLDLDKHKPLSIYINTLNQGILAKGFSAQQFQALLKEAGIELTSRKLAKFTQCNQLIRDLAEQNFTNEEQKLNWLEEQKTKRALSLTKEEIKDLAENTLLKNLIESNAAKSAALKPNSTLAIFAHGTGQGEALIGKKGIAKPRMQYRNILNQFIENCRTPHLILEGPDQLGTEVFRHLEVAEKFIVEQARQNPELKRIAFAGFSRGAVTGKRLAYRFNSPAFKAKYPDIAARNLEFDIFAIDPVAGTTNKADPSAVAITSNVRNYVATYQLDEPRFILKPQGPSRTIVEDPSKTSVTFLRMPGVHGAGTVMMKGKQTQHVPKLTWHLLHDFMVKNGVEFEGQRVPPLTVYDKQVQKGGYLSEAEKYYPDKLKYTGDAALDKATDLELLNLYADLKVNRANYHYGKKAERSGNDHLEDFVLEGDYFLNQHERELFKRSFPVVFNYFFEQYQPELPLHTERYPLETVLKELTENSEHPSIVQLIKKYAKDKTVIDKNKDNHALEFVLGDKNYHFIPGGSYRIEQAKFTRQLPIATNTLEYLERKALDTLMAYCRNRSLIKKNKYHQQAKDMRSAVREIMKDNISDASKAYKILSLLDKQLQTLNPKVQADKKFISAMNTILDDPYIKSYRIELDKTTEFYFEKQQLILTNMMLLNDALKQAQEELHKPSAQGITLANLAKLATAQTVSVKLDNFNETTDFFEGKLTEFKQHLDEINSELKKYQQVKQEFNVSSFKENLEQAEKLAAMGEWYQQLSDQYAAMQLAFVEMSNSLSTIKKAQREEQRANHAKLAYKIEHLKPTESLLFKDGKFSTKPVRIIGASGKGSKSRAAFEALLTMVVEDMAQGYISWPLLDKAAASTWGKKVLTNIPYLKNEYQKINDIIISSIAEALNYTSKELFLKITNEEILQPSKYGDPKVCPNIAAYTAHFNQISTYAINTILAESNIDLRTAMMERWIWVMDACLAAGNFHAARAISSALANSAVYRLKATYAGLSAAAHQKLNDTNKLFSTDNNSKELSQAMLKSGKATIPFMGLINSIMVFAKDGNANKDFTALDSVKNTLDAIGVIRANAHQFRPNSSPLSKSLADILGVYDSNSIAENIFYATSLAYEPRGENIAASTFVKEFTHDKEHYQLVDKAAAEDKPQPLIATEVPQPLPPEEPAAPADQVPLDQDEQADSAIKAAEAESVEAEIAEDITLENLQPGVFLNPVLNRIYEESPHLFMLGSLDTEQINAVNQTLFEPVSQQVFRGRLKAAGFAVTDDELRAILAANEALKRDISPHILLELSKEPGRWAEEIKQYIQAQTDYINWVSQQIALYKTENNQAQMVLWEQQLQQLRANLISDAAKTTILSNIDAQIEALLQEINQLAAHDVKYLEQDSKTVLENADNTAKLYYLSGFLQDKRWQSVIERLEHYQHIVDNLQAVLQLAKQHQAELSTDKAVGSSILQLAALNKLVTNNIQIVAESKKRLSETEQQLLAAVKPKVAETAASQTIVAAEIAMQFENRYLRQLLAANVLQISKPISPAQVALFNIHHRDIKAELAKLGITGITDEQLTELQQAEQELNLIHKIKNSPLKQYLIHADGPTLWGISATQLEQFNNLTTQGLQQGLEAVNIAIPASEMDNINLANLRLRSAQLFISVTLAKAVARNAGLIPQHQAYQLTSAAKQAIKEINQLMLGKHVERETLETLLHQAGLKADWLDQKISEHDKKQIVSDDKPDITWWDALVLEQRRLSCARHIMHPVLREIFIKNPGFNIAADADLSEINRFSSSLRRGKLNECLAKLVPGWAVSEEQYAEIIAFNKLIESIANRSLSAIQKQLIASYETQLNANRAKIYPLDDVIKLAQHTASGETTPFMLNATIGDLMNNLDAILGQKAGLIAQAVAIENSYQEFYQALSPDERKALLQVTDSEIPISDIGDYRDNSILYTALLRKQISEQLALVETYHQQTKALLHNLTLHNFDSYLVYLQTLTQEKDNCILSQDPVALKNLLKTLENKLRQLPAGDADAISRQFNFMTSPQDVVEARARLLQYQAEVQQALAAIKQQQLAKQEQEFAKLYESSPIHLQVNMPAPEAAPAKPQVSAKPDTLPKDVFKPAAAELPVPEKLVAGAMAKSEIDAASQAQSMSSPWLKDEKISDNLTRHIHRNGLSVVKNQNGTSFYERSVAELAIDEELQARERELCAAWADLLLPQIVNPPVTIGGYDQNLKKIMAEEFNKRGIAVIFEHEKSTPAPKDEESSYLKKGFFDKSRSSNA